MSSGKGRIPHSRPDLGEAEVRAVTRVVRSGQIASGAEVERLEGEFAARLGFAQAVAVASGSAGLHLALLALGVGRGDRVLAPSYVCVAVLNAIRQAGARELLVDVAPGGFNLDLDQAVARAPRARAAIVPHLFGSPADAARLARTGVAVIEDCAMALGARAADGRAVGRCGRLAVYSLYATKAVAAGQGGLVATDDGALAAELRDLRSYDKRARWRLRFNYQLSDLAAALARPQLARLERGLARRRRLAHLYRRALAGTRLGLPAEEEGASWFRFVVRAPDLAAAEEAFARAGVEVARPVHQPLHRALELAARRFPRTEELFLTALSLPIYPTLARRDLERVVAVASRL